jgi:hypothetical protein
VLIAASQLRAHRQPSAQRRPFAGVQTCDDGTSLIINNGNDADAVQGFTSGLGAAPE